MIVWYLNLGDDAGHTIFATVDDETGLLLSLEYYTKAAAEDIYYEEVPTTGHLASPTMSGIITSSSSTLRSLKTAWPDYYGLEAGSMEYIKDSTIFHYELELSDGSASTKLHVVISEPNCGLISEG
jgi:hypothetical protein